MIEYVAWIVSTEEYADLVPDEGTDLCPTCAEQIVAEARGKTKAAEEEIFMGGGGPDFSNESDVEMECIECGQPLYTILVEEP